MIRSDPSRCAERPGALREVRMAIAAALMVVGAVVVAGCSVPESSAVDGPAPPVASSDRSVQGPPPGADARAAAPPPGGARDLARHAAGLLDAGVPISRPDRWRELGLEPWVLTQRYALVRTMATPRSSGVPVGATRGEVLVAVRGSFASPWSVRALPVARAADGPDVNGDGSAGAIVAEGSILLPGDFVGDADARAAGTDCPGCRWRLDLACPQQGELCSGALVGCAAGDLRYVVRLLRPPSTEFIVIGTLCRGPGEELLAVDELADRVRDRFVELLPRAAPAVQPVEGLLVQVPAVLRSGEPESIGPVEARIAGYAVTLSATATWTWRFGDGGMLTTNRPGGRYPDTSVSHVFRRPGRYLVEVETSWDGEFLVDGRGPYPVAGGPVALRATLPVRVQEARAVLVAS